MIVQAYFGTSVLRDAPGRRTARLGLGLRADTVFFAKVDASDVLV
jgi:hypothetical protein